MLIDTNCHSSTTNAFCRDIKLIAGHSSSFVARPYHMDCVVFRSGPLHGLPVAHSKTPRPDDAIMFFPQMNPFVDGLELV